jgi:hypothetical protein
LQKTPVQYQGLYHVTVYYCRLGNMEFVYPSTFSYLDGMASPYTIDDPAEMKFSAPDELGEVGGAFKRKGMVL